jgi:DNA helicase-2/ATP-dependent DNA helicase PcrA
MQLNPQQEDVAEHVFGRILTLAGPGSGKTRTLTERTGRLIRKGYDPGSILCLTFTNKARDEMRERIAAAAHGPRAAKVFISNFHGLCGILLRRYGGPLGYGPRMTICDDGDQIDLIMQIARKRGLEPTKPRARTLAYVANDFRENLGAESDLGSVADGRIDAAEQNVVRGYVEALRQRNQCDFSGLLSETVRLLRERPEVQARLQTRFRFIQVDEYQDTNRAQNEIVELLAGTEDNVLAVGDGDQCVIAGTVVTTPGGPKPIEKLRQGMQVLAATGNGRTDFLTVRRFHRKRVKNYPVVTITLRSGRTLTATREHVHFAEYKQRSVEARWFVYLMYRADRGYRLGVTKHLRKHSRVQSVLGFKGRLNQEEGDAIWLLGAYGTEAEARYWEQVYSLRYGIPTTLFDALPMTDGKVACEYAARVFATIPTRDNVKALFEDLWLHASRPHHVPRSTQQGRRRNFCVVLCGDARQRSLHSYQISGSDDTDRATLARMGLNVRSAKATTERANRRGWRVESSHADLGDVYGILDRVRQRMEVNVVEKGRFGSTSLAMTPASHVRPGMEVFVAEHGRIREDIVEAVEMRCYTGEVFDLDVERCHNYVANGIVTHNSIYEWRGASPDGIPRFIRRGEAKTGTCKVVKLGVNYRSTPQIVAVADTLIRHCAERIPVEFSTVNKPGEAVKCAALEKPEDEAEAVASSNQNELRSGTVAREIAVFYRANDMSRLMEQSLAKRQIPYRVVGSGSYYDRVEVKDVLSMLRFLCNPRDGISFHRVVNKPARGMGDALVGKLEAFAERHDIDLLTALRRATEVTGEDGKPLGEAALRACADALNVFGFDTSALSVAQVVNEVLDRSKYDDWLKDRYADKGEYDDRRRNVNELANSIAVYCQENHRGNIADYLQSIALYTGNDAHADDENAVRLMSLHASKGLEFDVVYLIGVEQGVLPHEKALKDRGERRIRIAVARAWSAAARSGADAAALAAASKASAA